MSFNKFKHESKFRFTVQNIAELDIIKNKKKCEIS